ncbi:MAG: hypothetical protein M1836_005132 [Candelina mexicana]|nr:MAG: hypothetical protein M1836_005132 [Candelina mexicana]
MATAAVHVPAQSHDRVETGSYTLAAAKYPNTSDTSKVDVEKVVLQWVSDFNLSVGHGDDPAVLKELFLTESYWRDQLCLSWTFHTWHGPKDMASFLQKNRHRDLSISIDKSNEFRAPKASTIDCYGNVNAIQGFLELETDVGRGRGLVRLVQDGGKWKAFTLFTALQELKGYEEHIRERRPLGVIHGSDPNRKNWKELRVAEENVEGSEEPTVLIIGAGQGGLTSAARLGRLGIKALIIDKEDRVGDNWRNRYHHLVLHDPVWYDHLPYIKFPETWPIFTPKDKLGDWFESYASSMELNVWTKSTLTSSKWDDSKRQWTVELNRTRPDGSKESRVLHPRHIIQATGHSGEMNFPVIKGMENFKGDSLCHSSQFQGARKGEEKRAIVVGCCNSGHDIAQDFYEHGYDVTVVQRSSTYIISSDAVLEVFLAGLYEENGPPVEDADLFFMSMPNAVMKRLHQELTIQTKKKDHEILTGLKNRGFKDDSGPDNAGFFMKYFQCGGGYYIDVGASKLIADGKIHIKQGQEISSINEHSITFADGVELPADAIVFATGYQNMRGTARKIFGDELADRVSDVEGELRAMWRGSGHPGFWFFGGNLALCRYYSRLLALQIKAVEEGLMKPGEA